MKRFVTILLFVLTACLCCGFLACEKKKVTKVELTLENYEEYITIYEGSVTYTLEYLQNVQKYVGSAEATLEISSMNTDYEFEGVEIQIETRWYKWHAFQRFPETVKLNNEGSAKKKIEVDSPSISPMGEPEYELFIIDVKGYVFI